MDICGNFKSIFLHFGAAAGALQIRNKVLSNFSVAYFLHTLQKNFFGKRFFLEMRVSLFAYK